MCFLSLSNHYPIVKSGVRSSGPTDARAALDHLAATLRPGTGATNAGLTPAWYTDGVKAIDDFRTRLAAADAAEVVA